jgi:hypothetical protein
MNASTALSFRETTFHPIQREGNPWLTASEISSALGYAREDSVSRIYERNAGEFTDSMTLTVKLTVKGFGNGNSKKEVRIFSLRGAHLVAMFARTPRAAEFRRWVLDILDRQVSQVETTAPAIPLAGQRWLMDFDETGKPSMCIVPNGAFVLRPSDIAAAIGDPGRGVSRKDLINIMQAALKRIDILSIYTTTEQSVLC